VTLAGGQVSVDGVKHIMVFALRELPEGEEITYDYKLPLEPIKIPCHCAAPECRGYLN
jgi:SET domain-containing protein